MLLSHREEVESIDDISMITQIYLHECAICSALVKICLPVLPDEEVIGLQIRGL